MFQLQNMHDGIAGYLIALTLLASSPLFAAEEKQQRQFHIQKCSSGVDYPTKGDEAVDVNHETHAYRLRILHPNILKGPHVSVPFFWVEPRGNKEGFGVYSIVSPPSHVGALTWHSANIAYFFAEEPKGGAKPFAGFFLQDGWDNADWGACGLLFVYDGNEVSAWNWGYSRKPEEKRGRYIITNAIDKSKNAPDSLVERLAPILDRAERDADSWPGP